MVNEPEERPVPVIEAVSEAPQPEAPEDAVPVPVDPVRQNENPWTVGEWSKLPNYECTLCPFSTLDLPIMEEHQRLRHTTNDPAPDQARTRRRYMRRE